VTTQLQKVTIVGSSGALKHEVYREFIPN